MTVAAYHRYDNYKQSGVDWIGEIPSHWSVERSKWLFHERKERARRGEPQLAATQKYGVIPQSEFMELEGRRVTQVFLDFSILKHVEAGDFVMSMRSFQGGLEYSECTGCVSSAYVALDPQHAVFAPFYKYLLKSTRYIEALQSTSNLVRDGQALRFENFAMVDLFAPPLPEQRAISSFLDGKCAKIDEAVRIKEKQIALMRERRQILIQQAVTRGLNPNAAMKDSGLDWIGQIPAHWKAIPLKHLFRERNERTRTGTEILFSLRMIEGLVPHDDVSEKPISDAELVDYKKIYPGQMVMNRMRASIGLFGFASQAGLVSPDYAVFDMRKELYGAFYLQLFKTAKMGARFRLSSRGLGTGSSGFMRLYTDDFGAISVPVPSIEEQHEIVEYIKNVSGKIARAIEYKQGQIAALKEYKTSLINSAVTGKIKVI